MEKKMYRFATLDPRPIPAAQAANEKVFSAHIGVFGVEVTIPGLADRCMLGNVDPQHGCHRETYDNGGYVEVAPGARFVPGEAAIEFAARQVKLTTCPMAPPDGATLVTVRPDLDSVGAMAIYAIALQGQDLGPAAERIAAVVAADKFAMGEWPGERPLPTPANPWPEGGQELAAIALAIADHEVPLVNRVAAMERWLLTGEEPASYRVIANKERTELIRALGAGEIKLTPAVQSWCMACGSAPQACPCAEPAWSHHRRVRVVAVESTHRTATGIGYAYAPVVVALNPAFRVGGGEPHRKFTVCAYTAQDANIRGALAELAVLEPGWGGSPTIGGSPQGVSSTLTTEQVVEVVAKHLNK